MEDKYYQTEASVAEYIQLAKDVSGAELIEKLKQFLAPGAAILEIGSGPGTDWNLLSQTFEVTGSDFSLEFLKYLNRKYPQGQFLQLDAITLETDRKFEGIYSNKVLHHLREEELETSVENQSRILSQNGIICHSFWKGTGNEIFKGLFVNYHEVEDLEKIFGPNFEILLIEPYAEFEEGDSLLLIGRKK